MLWKNRRQSGNVVDRRGMGGPIGIGGLLLGAVFYYLMGGNPLEYIAVNSNQATSQRQEAKPQNDDQKQFVAVVLADTEDVWNLLFQNQSLSYQEPKLVLFSGGVRSACGNASSSVGPFYCPGDHQLYLDLNFFQDLQTKLGAEGDFATAYVIAHEVGHHVQTLLGVGRPSNNQASVRMELQADCFAGVWANHTESGNVLEEGDIEEAVNAAAAVGDDRIMQKSGREVVPDSFTHGSSAQRVAAFKRGYESGQMDTCM